MCSLLKAIGGRPNFLVTAASLLTVAFVLHLLSLAPSSKAQSTHPPYVQGQLIIKFGDRVEENQKKELLSSLNFVTLRKLSLIRADLVRISDITVETAISLLEDDPSIQYVEPNYIWHADLIPDDPDFDRLWGMHNTGQTGGTVDADIDAVEAWDISTGNSVIIGVIDTGVDTAHVDLAGNIWTNPGEIADNGVDDDDNGYIDDVHGWDFVNWDNGPVDDHGHGTHCAGIMAAVGNNSVGVAGVCWSARMMPLKFLDENGHGATAHAVLALEYATMMGADLTSNSWAGGSYSQALKDAIDASGAQGMLFVAGAGNDRRDNDLSPSYPSSYDLESIIAVAATDHNDQLADEPTWGSNWGLTSVDLGAPGVSVYSTLPGDNYGYKSGTSMATPHVSGAVAMIWSACSTLSGLQVKERIMSKTDPVPDLAGKCVTGGRLNAYMAIAEPDSIPPSTISDLSAVKSEASRITLSWTAPGDDSTAGKAAYYDVRYSFSPLNDSNFDSAFQAFGEPQPQPVGSPESFMVTGLDFNTSYYFAVLTLDEWNNPSGVSNSPAGTTLGPPDIEVTPDSLFDTLYTNGGSARALNIANLEEGELLWEIDVQYPVTTEASGKIIVPPATSMISGRAASGEQYESAVEEVQFDISGEKITTIAKDVLLVYADEGASVLKSILEGYPDIAAVDEWYAGALGGTIPTFSDLQDYDVVVAWNNQAWYDNYAIGDVLADYIDHGGAVVTTVDCWDAGILASRGRYFDDRDYNPFRSLSEALYKARTLGWHNPAHPIMDGVDSLTTKSFYNNVAFSDDAVEVARWDDGTPLVAVNPHTVAINVWPGDPYYWTGDFPTLIHNTINYLTSGAFWLSVYPDTGEVPPYGDTILSVDLDAMNLDEGDHQANIVIRSNDPEDSLTLVPVHLHVIGTGDIALDSDSLDFGVVYIDYPRSRPLLVSNLGPDTLSVLQIVSDTTDFSVDVANFVLVPYEDTVVSVTFDPSALGEIRSNLTITSDDPDESALTVILKAEALICPDLWADPGSISDSLRFETTSVETLTVGNSGSSPLYVEVELANFAESASAPASDPLSIREVLGFRGKRSISCDPDAPTTADLYQAGNDGFSEISATPGDVLVSWPVPISIEHAWGLGFDGKDVWVSDIARVTDSEVDTLGTLLSWFGCSDWAGVWAADMAWDGEYVWQVNVGGDNGIYQLDPASGAVRNSIHDPSRTWDAVSQRGLAYDKKRDVFYVGGWNHDRVYKIKGLNWDNPGEILKSFYFPNVSGLAWHPEGSLWIAVNASTDYIFQVDPETGDILTEFLAPGDGSGHEGAGLALDRHGNLWCVSQVTQMAYLMDSGVPAFVWLEVAPWACTLGVGETRELEVRFDATALFGGDYSADIVIQSNDCDQPSLTIPAFFHVTGFPHMVISEDTLNYPTVFIGFSLTDTLVISNQGTDLLTISDISSDHPDYAPDTTNLSLSPGESQEVSVTFAPGSEGEIVAALTIESNDSTQPIVKVVLQGQGLLPPDMILSPDSLSEDLHTGERSKQALTISNQGHSDLHFGICIDLSCSSPGLPKVVQRHRQRDIVPRSDPAIPGKREGESSRYPQNEGIMGSSQAISVEPTHCNGGWESRAWMSQKRGYHGLVAHPDGKIYAFGGGTYSGGFIVLSSLEIYDPATDSWSWGSDMPEPDWDMACAIDDSGNIYSFTSTQSGSFRYDPSLDQWTTITPPPVIWVEAARAAKGLDGRIYVIGGAGPLDVVQIYDPDTDSWMMGTPMPTPRYELGVVAGPDGLIYAIGGRWSYQDTTLNIVEVYDPLTDTWSSAAPMPTARSELGLSLGADDKIYAIGGRITDIQGHGYLTDVVEIYDPLTDTWQTGPPLPSARDGMGAVLCGHGIYAIGGDRGYYSVAVNEFLETCGWLSAGLMSGTIPADSSLNVEITFDAKWLDGGGYEGNMVISSNDPYEPTVTIPAELHVTAAPDIAVSQAVLDYGQVFVGTSAMDTLFIFNQGTESLRVTRISCHNLDYTVDPSSFRLKPGRSQKVLITFAPSITGVFRVNLAISSDDPDEPTMVVRLQAEAADPPRVSISPDSLIDSLYSGEEASQTLTISNTGISDLIFNISVEETVPVPVSLNGGSVSSSEGKCAGDLTKGKDGPVWTSLHRDISETLGNIPSKASYYQANPCAYSGGALFVADYLGDEIFRLNPSTGEVLGSIPAPESPSGYIGLAFDGNYLYYVKAYGSNTIYQLDKTTGEIIATADIPEVERIIALAHSGDALYALGWWGSNTIYKIDFKTASIVDQHTFEFDLGGGMTYGGSRGTIFVPYSGEFVYEIDLSNWRILRRFQSPDLSYSYGLGYSQTLGLLFVNTYDWESRVYAVSPDDGAIIFSYPLAFDANGAAADEAAGLPWLLPSPASSAVPSGSAVDIHVSLDAREMYDGDYGANIVVLSNDPDEPEIRIPADMHVTGIPAIAISDDTLDYGDVFVGGFRTDTLIVSSLGSALLTVSNISSDNSCYTVDTTSFSLSPGTKQSVLVTFTPETVGQTLGTLTITSDDPDDSIMTVVLRGQGLAPPDIAVFPDSLKEELLIGDTSTQVITVSNQGENDLDFKIRMRHKHSDQGLVKFNPASLSRKSGTGPVGAAYPGKTECMVEQWGQAAWDSSINEMLLSNPPVEPAGEYTGDYLHLEIADYGAIITFQYPVSAEQLGWAGYTLAYKVNDQDHVRYVLSWWGEGIIPRSYTELINDSSQVVVEVATQTIDDVVEVTRLFTFDRQDRWVNIQTSVRNLSGVDLDDLVLKCFAHWHPNGDCPDDYWDYDTTRSMIHAWEHKYVGMGSSQVPDVMDIDTSGDYESRVTRVDFPTGPVFGLHAVGILHFELGNLSPGTSAIITTAWGAGDSLADLQGVIDRGLECRDWVSTNPGSGTIPPDSSLPISVSFDATAMTGGDRYVDIVFLTNDPDELEVIVPVHVHVIGIPDIAVSDSVLDYGGVFIGLSVTDTIIVSNQGTDLLRVTDISSENSDFSVDTSSFNLNVADSQEVIVTFTPTTDGEIKGTLTIVNDDPDEPITEIALQGEGLIPPDISVAADSLSGSMLVGQTSTQILTISNEGVSELTLDISVVEKEPTDKRLKHDIQSPGEWLDHRYKSTPLPLSDEKGVTAPLDPGAYFWQPEEPSVQMNVLVYADDGIHRPPNTFPDQALQHLGVAYTAHYEGDFAGFEADLTGGTWDLVLFANDDQFFPEATTFAALNAYVDGGGRLVLHGWTVGLEPDDPLWTTLGFSWVANDYGPPDSIHWWEPQSPIFNHPESVPELTSLNTLSYIIYGQRVRPLAGSEALAGYTLVPDSNKAAIIRSNHNRTVFKGFTDGQNSADLDGDSVLDGVELWTNLIVNTARWGWLSVDPRSAVIPASGSIDIFVISDATGTFAGEYSGELIITSNDPDEKRLTLPVHMKVVGRGDANADLDISILDVVYLINYLFKSGNAPDPIQAGDLNCDDEIDITDAVYLINYLFKDGPPPCR